MNVSNYKKPFYRFLIYSGRVCVYRAVTHTKWNPCFVKEFCCKQMCYKQRSAMFIRVANIESQNLSISSMSACNALYTTFQSKSVIIKFRFVRRNYGTSSRQAGTICSSLVTEKYSRNLRFRRKCGFIQSMELAL